MGIYKYDTLVLGPFWPFSRNFKLLKDLMAHKDSSVYSNGSKKGTPEHLGPIVC